MYYNLIAGSCFIGFFLVGHILVRINIFKLEQRLKHTEEYRDDFINVINGIRSNNHLDMQLYHKLIVGVDEMQEELGCDGIASELVDRLMGLKYSNYCVLINFLPELRNSRVLFENSMAARRSDSMIGMCDDMFLRHIGNLTREIQASQNKLFNPLSCFAITMRAIVNLPFNILFWCGIISRGSNEYIKNSVIITLLSKIIVIIGLLSSIITIILGWDSSIDMVKALI